MATASSLIYEANELVPVNGDFESYHKTRINLYTKAIELDPNNSTAYNNRGSCHQSLKNYSQALADFTKAIELDPESNDSYGGRGGVYNEIGEYQKAIADLKKSIELHLLWTRRGYYCGSLNWNYNELGKAYYNLKDYERAEDYFNKALAENDWDCDAYYGRGLIYYDCGNYERALAEFNKAFEHGFTYNQWSDKSWGEKLVTFYGYNDKWALFHEKRGRTYEALGEIEKAYADFAQAENLGYKPKGKEVFE